MERWNKASRADCISGISTMLATLTANVKLNSKSNRNDLAVISEHTICGLLNLLYGWNLRNANTSKHANFPSVDLVDPEAGIAVQVTVDNSVKKVDHTLAKFREHKLNRQFTRLIIMVITTDDPTPTMKNREDGCFYGERDIWNVSRLLKDVENEKYVEKLQKIAEYLSRELGYGEYAAEKEKESIPVQPAFSTQVLTEGIRSGTLETCVSVDTDTGDFQTRVIDTAGEKTWQTTVIEKEVDGKNTIGTTVLVETHGDNHDDSTKTETDTKETFLKSVPRKLKDWKRARQAKKEEKKKHTQTAASEKKKAKLLIPAVVLGIMLLIFLIPEKKLTQMPPELADYSVTINGETVSLPTTLGRLEEMGWILKDAEEYMGILVSAHSYYAYYGENKFWSGAATLTNGHGTIDVRLGNASNHTVSFEDCIVYEIACNFDFDSSYTGESVNTLEGPLGLVWKQSTFRDVKWPKGFTKENSFGTTYSYRLSDYQQCKFGFDRNTKKLKSLRITNRDEAAMAALMGSAYDTQPPEYSPEDLTDRIGVNIVFTIFDLIHNYEIPVGVTVAEYEKLGYTIERQPEYIVSKEHDDVYFRCDALNQIQAEACNPFSRALTPENCFICVMDTNYIKTDAQITLRFSDGEKGSLLSVGAYESLLREELKQLGILHETGANGELIIYPNQNNRDIIIKCWVFGDDRKISRIRVDLCKALQDIMDDQEYRNYLEEKFEGIG